MEAGHKENDERFNPKLGDAYTFVGIEAQTKLILCFELGRRDFSTTIRFVDKLKRATAGRFQLTTDGFVPYIGAVEDAFGADIDYQSVNQDVLFRRNDARAVQSRPCTLKRSRSRSREAPILSTSTRLMLNGRI